MDAYFAWVNACHATYRGGSRDFEKVALNIGHQGWPTKKSLGFRWSKKAKITLETIHFWRNIYISIFSISLYNESFPTKSFQFFKIYERLQHSVRKKKTEEICILFYQGTLYTLNFPGSIIDCFIKTFTIFFFIFRKLICSAIFAFWNQDDAKNIKRGNWVRQKARNDKLRYLLQK